MDKIIVKKSGIHGKGLFTTVDIKKGDYITYIKGKYTRKKVSGSKKEAGSIPMWYGVTRTLWIDPKGTIFCYFNHSCKPNTAIVGIKKVIALRNIKAGEELTFDYSMTDADPYWEMSCCCGSKNCRETLRAIQFTPYTYIQGHFPNIPKYFLNIYNKHHGIQKN